MSAITFSDLFPHPKPFIGVIHLPALPGAPLYGGRMGPVYAHALREAEIFQQNGVDGIIIENFGDKPFYPDQVPAETIAAMSALTREVVRQVHVPIGVNVLRNDAAAALAIAAVTGAHFIRVNVHVGGVLADQGILQGRAHHTLRLREQLRAPVLIFADVGVKHAAPLAALGLGVEARDASTRGMADALIVSGSGTGKATDLGDLNLVQGNTSLPVLIGSGTQPGNLPLLFPLADGFIVGSHLKKEGKVLNPVDPERVKQLHQQFKELRQG